MDREASGVEGVIPRVDVLGVHVSAINMDMAISCFHDWIGGGQREYVCITTVHGVIESLNDPDLRRIHNSSGLTTPDGMPLVWSSRYAGAFWVDRVYGPDLLLKVCEASLDNGWSHFFYGAAPGVADELVTRLESAYPGLRVVGTHSPPYRELSEGEVLSDVEMINRAGPDIVWVGLSTPKQERWMARFREHLHASVLVGIGAAFDIHAGRIPQAPKWIQRLGLEWAFRLAVEPRRLWRRYMSTNPAFVREVFRRPPAFVTPDPSTRVHRRAS